ncbi:MAG: hypothetical protein OHK0022_28080 [Roseiflexaceae bacterium]
MNTDTTPPEQPSAALEFIRTEYVAVKDEQKQNRYERNAALAAVGATLAALFWAAATQGWLWLLLLAPFATSISAWVFLSAERLVSLQRNYIKDTLAPAGKAASGRPVFGWETMPERQAFWLPRKFLAAVLQLGAFVAAPAAAMAVGLVATPIWAVWVVVPVVLLNILLLWIVGVWVLREVWS